MYVAAVFAVLAVWSFGQQLRTQLEYARVFIIGTAAMAEH